MPKLPKIQIKVPGTSANLGPGFDLMGLSLKTHNTFEFTFPELQKPETSLKGGGPVPFSPEEDLVWESYCDYFQKFAKGFSPIPYACKMELCLPLKGGLGSSASAIVAGLTLGREIHKRTKLEAPMPSETEFIHYLAGWEGHPDNTLPAYLGGLVFTYQMDSVSIRYMKRNFPNSISVFVLSPEFSIATEESRKALPLTYKTEDVIFNMSRIGAWMQFLEKRRFSDLLLALEDRIHTPYRILPGKSPLFPFLKSIQEKSIGICLSGSGPSLLLFCERKNSLQKEKIIQKELENHFEGKLNYQFRKIQPDRLGTQIKTF